MVEQPLISIGIPAYGRGAYLREALKSCLAQDYPRLEILVADDASTEDPWPAIADMASDRWSYVRHEKNRGGPANFNYLIQQSKGELFILHQDDDMLHPQFCQRAAAALSQDKQAVFYAGLMLRGPSPQGIIGYDLKTFNGPWLLFDYLKAQVERIESMDALCMLLMQTPFMHPSLAMRRDALEKIGGYFDEFMFASDNVTLGRMLLHGHALYDTRLSGYFRVHGANTSTSTSLTQQYVCRRRVTELFLPEIKRMNGAWEKRLIELLHYLPRRERWKILAEALEAGLPQELLDAIAQAVGKSAASNLWRARLFKARWRYQWTSRVTRR